MDDPAATAITCSPHEVTLLARMLGASLVLGLPDPYAGWLTEEIEEAWQQARADLLARRYLRPDPAGAVRLDPTVAALLAAWAWPAATVLLSTTTEAGPPTVRYFHLTAELAVEQTLAQANRVEVRAVAGAAGVYDRLVALLGLADQPAGAGAPLLLRRDDYEAARRQATAGQQEAAVRTVAGSGPIPAAAPALVAALARPLGQGALIALARHGGAWDVAGWAVLLGPEGAWQFRAVTRESADWVDITPLAGAGLRQEVRRILNRILPLPLYS